MTAFCIPTSPSPSRAPGSQHSSDVRMEDSWLQGIQSLLLDSAGARRQVARTHTQSTAWLTLCRCRSGSTTSVKHRPAHTPGAQHADFRAQAFAFLIGPGTTQACARGRKGACPPRRRRDGGVCVWVSPVRSLATWSHAVAEQVRPGGRLLGRGQPGPSQAVGRGGAMCRRGLAASRSDRDRKDTEPPLPLLKSRRHSHRVDCEMSSGMA